MRGGANDQLTDAGFAAWFGVSNRIGGKPRPWDAHGTSYARQAAKLPFQVHPQMLRHSTGYKLANQGEDGLGWPLA